MTAWSPLRGPRAAIALAAALLGVGLVAGRSDVAVLGLPVAAVAVVAARRPTGEGALHARIEPGGGTGEVVAVLTVDAPPDAELVVIGIAGEGERPVFAVLPGDRATPLRVRAPLFHTGPQTVLRTSARMTAIGAGAAQRLDEVVLTTTIGVAVEPVPWLPLPRSMSLRPGEHRASRPGDGVEFRDLHAFSPGDRLRRIDWRATARQSAEGALVVRRTDASAEAAAVLLLDTRIDVGEVVSEWYRNRPARKGRSALDVGRAAALSLAAAYIEAGDRVAFHDLGRPGVGVRTGGGRRQRDRIAAVLAGVAPSPARYLVPPPLPPGAVVLLLSTFLDEEPMALADLARAAGTRVVAVDVLPRPREEGLTGRRSTAFRLVRLEREERLRRLGRAGAAVVAWDGDRTAALLTVARPRGRR